MATLCWVIDGVYELVTTLWMLREIRFNQLLHQTMHCIISIVVSVTSCAIRLRTTFSWILINSSSSMSYVFLLYLLLLNCILLFSLCIVYLELGSPVPISCYYWLWRGRTSLISSNPCYLRTYFHISYSRKD